MTQTLQPGQHPDADQLSAFAEHALPPHEQQQLFAHLATCPDCRTLVFLAQEAVPVVAAAQPQPATTPSPWFSFFSGWKLAIPAAAALACLIAVSVHLHNQAMQDRMAAATNQTAHVEPTPPPPPPPPPAQPIAAAQPAPLKTVPAETAKPSPVAAPTINGFEEAKTLGNASVHGAAQPLGLGGLAGRSTTTPSVNEFRSEGASHQSSFGIVSSAGYAAPKPVTAAAAPGAVGLSDALAGPLPQGTTITTGTSLDSVATSDQAAASAPGTPPRPAPTTMAALHSLNQQYSAAPPLPTAPPAPTLPAAAPVAANETVSVTSAAPAVETQSATLGGLISSASFSALQANRAQLAKKKQPELPSHLPVLATAANAHQQLALDTAGTLFRSQDAGVTWQTVAAQWTGRAVKITLSPSAPTPATPAKDASAVAAKSAPAVAAKSAPAANAAPAPPAQPALFILTTDTGTKWTSPDGQTWKHQ